MAVQQLSVFIESKVGHLKRILDAFVENDISVKGYALSDTGDYGIARFVVDKPERAFTVLEGMGAAVKQTDVLCLKLMDVPGELARVFDVIAKQDMNVKYSYSLISTYIAIGVDDVVKAESALVNQPVELVSQVDFSS
ncbi:amino acid-binding protein [Anaerotardibacter muris]|uniref:amino acid-binding protein n=1 Tax=Anaerotardibacter muris TaxID=2941505 RepID=UPI00203FAA06|nr:amino acid-binding protein [Anaerotardibacter muris]